MTPERGPEALRHFGDLLQVRDDTISELKSQLADLQQRVAKLEPQAPPAVG